MAKPADNLTFRNGCVQILEGTLGFSAELDARELPAGACGI